MTFQFLIGRLTSDCTLDSDVTVLQFQFLIGRLTSSVRVRRRKKVFSVSIPHR